MPKSRPVRTPVPVPVVSSGSAGRAGVWRGGARSHCYFADGRYSLSDRSDNVPRTVIYIYLLSEIKIVNVWEKHVTPEALLH